MSKDQSPDAASAGGTLVHEPQGEFTQPAESTAGTEYGVAVLKGAIGAIPYAGTMLNEVLFEARARLKQRRLERFIASLAARGDELQEAKLDKVFIRTPEFSDLLEQILIQVTRTQSELKRDLLRGVTVQALRGDVSVDFSAMYLDVLDHIIEAEVAVLRGFSDFVAQKRIHPDLEADIIEYADGLWGLTEFKARQVVQALVAKGLLVDDSHGRFGTDPFTVILPSELGIGFLEFVDGVKASPHD